MIPGQVVALESSDIHRTGDLLEGLSFLLDIQTYGNQLNLIVSGEMEEAEQAISECLTAEQIEIKRMESASIRMEEAFIYLVKAAREEVEA